MLGSSVPGAARWREMSARRESPNLEALIERTVRSEIANARASLRAALGPLERRKETYGASALYRALGAAYDATVAAEVEVGRWRIRTAPQGELLPAPGDKADPEPPPSAFDLDEGVCSDCGKPGERTGHQDCQFPQDHP